MKTFNQASVNLPQAPSSGADIPPPLPAKRIKNTTLTAPPLPPKQRRYPPQLSPQITAIPDNERQALYKLLNACSNYNQENKEHSDKGMNFTKFPF